MRKPKVSKYNIIPIDYQHLPSDSKDPLPLIIADKWKFELQRHSLDDEYWFSILDWIVGIGKVNYQTAASYFDKIKDGISISVMPMQYEASGRIILSHFTTDNGLYRIAEDMPVSNQSLVLKAIKAYLSEAGKIIDRARLDPEEAEIGLHSYHERKLRRLGRDDDFINLRSQGIRTRKQFMDLVKLVCGKDANYAAITNDVYRGALENTARQLREVLGLKPGQNPRDYLSPLALSYVGTTEEACRIALQKYGDNDVVSEEDVRTVIQIIARSFGVHAKEMASFLKIDLITGAPLLTPPQQGA